MKRRRRDAVDALGDQLFADIESGAISPSEVDARLKAFHDERLRYHAAAAEAATGIPASVLLAREKGESMGFYEVERTATRLRRRPSKWLSYVVPVLAALVLCAIATLIIVAVAWGGGR